MKKYKIDDLTLMIPLKIDHYDRIEHLCFLLDFIYEEIDIPIIVTESDDTQRIGQYPELTNIIDKYNVDYYYTHTESLFSMSKIANFMANKSKTKFVGLHACDVFLPERCQYLHGRDVLYDNFAITWPFYWYYGLDRDLSNYVMKTRDFSIINNNKGYEKKHIVLPDFIGCAIFYNRDKIMHNGGWNENFVGWGHEDCEFRDRNLILGEKIRYNAGYVVHLDHWKDPNWGVNSTINWAEYDRIRYMTKEELKEEISKWSWKW